VDAVGQHHNVYCLFDLSIALVDIPSDNWTAWVSPGVYDFGAKPNLITRVSEMFLSVRKIVHPILNMLDLIQRPTSLFQTISQIYSMSFYFFD
jgi:hypothetical protein